MGKTEVKIEKRRVFPLIYGQKTSENGERKKKIGKRKKKRRERKK